MKKNILNILVCISFVFSVSFAEISETFLNYTEPFPIYAATLFNDSLALGVSGGIRFVSEKSNSTFYTSEKGLEASAIFGVAVHNGNLYAVSNSGVISVLKKEAKKFQVLNRSLQEKGKSVLPSLVQVCNGILVIALENKLSFFDLKNNVFLISVSRIYDKNLENTKIRNLIVRNDSLYIGIDDAIYFKTIEQNLLADKLFADPYSWKELSAKEKDLILSSEKTEDVPKVLENNAIQWTFTHKNLTYFVSADKIYLRKQNNEILDLSPFPAYTLGPTYELFALEDGGILAAGINQNISYINETGVSVPFSVAPEWPSFTYDTYSFPRKVLSATDSRETFYSIWGYGTFLYHSYETFDINTKILATMGSCLENYLTDYLVVPSATKAPDNSGFLFTFWGKAGYGIAYQDLSGEVYCLPSVGSTPFSGSILARQTENNSYEVFVANASQENITGNGKIERFVIYPPTRSGQLEILEKSILKTPNNMYPTDMTFDKDGYLWASTYTSVGYISEGDSLQTPHQIKQFSTSAISAIACDPTGNIWLSTNANGLFRLEKVKNSSDTLKASNYTIADGLASNNLFDLTLDSRNGILWIATDKGISAIKRKDLRSAKTFMTGDAEKSVLVYPNPFRPKIHDKIIFDYLAEGARVQIYNSGYKLVYSAADEALTGGRLEWNGKDKSGNLVAPGVYHYVIKNKSKSKKGKLLIIH